MLKTMFDVSENYFEENGYSEYVAKIPPNKKPILITIGTGFSVTQYLKTID